MTPTKLSPDLESYIRKCKVQDAWAPVLDAMRFTPAPSRKFKIGSTWATATTEGLLELAD